MYRIDTIIQSLNSLHKKILSSDFAEQVTEPEMLSIVFAMQLLHCHKPGENKANTFYRFRFADGYECIAKGFSSQELRVEEDKHGKLLSKKKEAT